MLDPYLYNNLPNEPCARLSSMILHPPPSRLHIIPPLCKHPQQTPRANAHRARKGLPPPRRAEHKPLRRKVRKRNGIRPDSELVERRLVDVVRGVEPDYAREERPGPERARREPGDVVGFARWRVECGWVVDARGVREGAVGLD
jgi:hypothetical protein